MSNELPDFDHLTRVQLPGAPEKDRTAASQNIVDFVRREVAEQVAKASGIGSAVEAVASPASDEVTTRLATVEAEVAALKEQIAALPASASTADDPSVVQRLDAIDRACVALQGSISKLEAASTASAKDASTIEAIQKRVSSLESRPAAAPARAAAPAARPSAATA